MIPETRFSRSDHQRARHDRDVLGGLGQTKTCVFFLEKKCFSPNFSESPNHPDHALHVIARGRL